MEWRKDLDREIGQYVDDMIKKTSFFPAYRRAEKPANAQLWTALGIMAKKLYEQELKIQLLEGVLKEISPKKVEKVQTREARNQDREEIERIMKEIAQRKPITITEKPKTSLVFEKMPRRAKSKKRTSKKEFEDIKRDIKSNF